MADLAAPQIAKELDKPTLEPTHERVCVNCKHLVQNQVGVLGCRSPHLGRDRVTGQAMIVPADLMRNDEHWITVPRIPPKRCGPTGSWFERKSSIQLS